MTRQEVNAYFREFIMPEIRAQEWNGPDYPMRREAWNIYTDALCKEGQITPEQYEEWVAPYECSPG